MHDSDVEVRYKIESPKQTKHMVVKKTMDGKLISIEDEKGNPAKTCDPGKVRLTDENAKFRSPSLYASDDTFILTRHNPTCGWYWYDRRWHYICTNP